MCISAMGESQKKKSDLVTFKIRLANTIIEVQNAHVTTRDFCKEYVVFDNVTDISIKVPKPGYYVLSQWIEKNGFPKPQRFGDNVAGTFNIEVLEPLILYREIADSLIDHDIILMHAAAVAFENQCYLFCAPSGIGKTTRANIWIHEFPGSIIVNGDKPLIKITDNIAFVCGTPWCGKEGLNTNTIVPLKCIFFIERIENGETDTIQEIGFGKAFIKLMQHSYFSNEAGMMRKTINVLKKLEGKAKCYVLRCAPTPEAIHLAYEVSQRWNQSP